MKHLKQLKNLIPIIIIITFLTITANYNYLLFHVFIELFAIVIAFSLFTITWNSRHLIHNKYLIIVGISALFIGILDTFHTLTYKGMNIIDSPIFFANQFWIGTRFLESTTLLAGFAFINYKKKINTYLLLIIYSFVSLIIVLSILYFKVFPTCYITGVGQTTFKIVSEYIIMAILVAAIITLYKNKKHFEPYVYKLLFASMIFAVISEFSFTLYISNYGISNQIGHYAKLITFFLIYKANIQTGFIKPAQTIFKDLKGSEDKYKKLYTEYKNQGIELKKRNEEYQRINKELHESNATKDKFFSIIAHDLKNPFNSILGLTGILKNNSELYSPDKTKKIIEALDNSANNAYKLLENLLQWSRSQLNRIDFSPETQNLFTVVEEIISIYSSEADRKTLTVENSINTDTTIYADINMLNTIIRNLLSNAIKFTPENGKINLKAEKMNQQTILKITDTGIGIPKNKIEILFEPGSKVSTLGTNKESGTGLGLIICKEFMTKHKGEISVDSNETGTSFSLSFPNKRVS